MPLNLFTFFLVGGKSVLNVIVRCFKEGCVMKYQILFMTVFATFFTGCSLIPGWGADNARATYYRLRNQAAMNDDYWHCDDCQNDNDISDLSATSNDYKIRVKIAINKPNDFRNSAEYGCHREDVNGIYMDICATCRELSQADCNTRYNDLWNSPSFHAAVPKLFKGYYFMLGDKNCVNYDRDKKDIDEYGTAFVRCSNRYNIFTENRSALTEYDLQKYQKDREEADREAAMIYQQYRMNEQMREQQLEQQRQQNHLRWRQTQCSTVFGSTNCTSVGW